jgi:hypothetical protein
MEEKPKGKCFEVHTAVVTKSPVFFGYNAGLSFDPEDGKDKLLRNVG